MRCRKDEAELGAAIKNYKNTHAKFSPGTGADIIKPLRGDNAERIQRIQFLVVHPRRVNPRGAYFDPWVTSYSIEFPSSDHFEISSAGEDKLPGTKDDIILDSTKNDFAKP